MFSALKMSATFSVTGAVIGEQTASSTGGLGVYLTEQQSRLNTAGVFGDILLLAAMGVTAFALIALWESFSTPWRRRSTAPRRHRFALTDTDRAEAEAERAAAERAAAEGAGSAQAGSAQAGSAQAGSAQAGSEPAGSDQRPEKIDA
jgi:hypothetical protein